MAVEVTRMIASVGSSIAGSGDRVDAHVALAVVDDGLHELPARRDT